MNVAHFKAMDAWSIITTASPSPARASFQCQKHARKFPLKKHGNMENSCGMRVKKSALVLTSVIIVYSLVFLRLEGDYGLTYDEPGDFFYSERYYLFYKTFDWKYLDFQRRAMDFYKAERTLISSRLNTNLGNSTPLGFSYPPLRAISFPGKQES